MEQQELLFNKLSDLANKAEKTGCTASRFITPSEAHAAELFFRRNKQIELCFDGGFENAERVRAVFLNPDWGTYQREDMFAILKIVHRPQDSLGHRDILGAIMALGIERDTVGDIYCQDNYAYVICLPELGQYISENLNKAGRVGITVSQAGLDELPIKQEDFKEKTETVASLRLDAILAAAFDLPRAKASDLIVSGKVSVDYGECAQVAKELCEGALISVRGLGRAKLLEVGGKSRKGRVFVKLGVTSAKQK